MSSLGGQRLMFGAVLLVLVVAGALYVLQPWNSETQRPNSTGSSTNKDDSANFELVTMGSPNAPVTLEEYSDFQCSICRRYVTTIKDQINTAFVDSGQVQVVFHHYIRYGEESMLAAQAAECAGEQGKFWDYHRTLYDEQKGINRGSFTPETIVDFAERLSLDIGAFQSCVDSGRHIAKIEAETAKGRELGILSTPGFVLNGKLIGFISSLDAFGQLVDQATGAGALRDSED